MIHFRNPSNKKLDLHANQNLHFEFSNLNIILPSTVSQTFVATSVYLLSFLSSILKTGLTTNYQLPGDIKLGTSCTTFKEYTDTSSDRNIDVMCTWIFEIPNIGIDM